MSGPDAEERRQSERGSCEPDDGTAEMGFRPGLGGSFGSLSSLECAFEDDGAKTVDDASSTQHAVRAGEAFATWEGHHAEGLSRRPTREAALPDGVTRKPTGMPGDDSAVERHAAHQARIDRWVGRWVGEICVDHTFAFWVARDPAASWNHETPSLLYLPIHLLFIPSIQACFTQMLATAAAHVVAQKHMDWLDAQRVCADRIEGARNCSSPAGWLLDPTIDAV